MHQSDLRAIRPQMQLQTGGAQAVIGAPDSHFSNATWTRSERSGPGAWLASRVCRQQIQENGKPSAGSGEPDIS